jgi:hypothetical protein
MEFRKDQYANKAFGALAYAVWITLTFVSILILLIVAGPADGALGALQGFIAMMMFLGIIAYVPLKTIEAARLIAVVIRNDEKLGLEESDSKQNKTSIKQ